MSVHPNSPWRVMMGSDVCETSTSYERIDKIRRSDDRQWLRRVVAWADQTETVTKAAERRLRVLGRKEGKK